MIDFLLVAQSPGEDPLGARQAYRLHRELSRRGLASQLLYHGAPHLPPDLEGAQCMARNRFIPRFNRGLQSACNLHIGVAP